jgi:hypothetical protein
LTNAAPSCAPNAPHLADVHARLFPPVSDEIFRLAMEKALLGVGKASRFRGALKSKAGGG